MTDSRVFECINIVLSCLALTIPSKEKAAMGLQFEEIAVLESRNGLVFQTGSAILVPALCFCF